METTRVWHIVLALLLQLVALEAFADVTFATTAEDSRAKQALPPPGKALVYVFRQDSMGLSTEVPVWFDGNRIGASAPRSYFLWAVDPGKHTVASRQDRSVAVTLQIQAGRNYFVEQRIVTGGDRVELRQVSYAQGRVAVSRCRLIKDDSVFAAAALGKPAERSGAKPTAKPFAGTSDPGHTPSVVLILKTGSVKLSSHSQTIQTTTGAVPSEFDSKVSSVFGIEGEWRMDDGIALGIELIRYSSKLTATGTGLTSTMDVAGELFNGKKYFTTSGYYHPYLGIGVGVARADFSGSAITGSTAGVAYQTMGGIEFRWRQVGVYTELKVFSAKTKVDAGSRGLYVGASVLF